MDEELKFLRWFFQEADFGPAHGDVIEMIKTDYEATGNVLPEGYGHEE